MEYVGCTKETGRNMVALQEYGAAMVMCSNGTTLFGEGLWSDPERSWEGVLDEDSLKKIPFKHYRFIESGEAIQTGMIPTQHPGIMSIYYSNTKLPNFDYTELQV